MMKILGKKNKREDEEDKKEEPKAKISPAQIRLRTDLQEVECPPNVEMNFPDPKNIMKFEVLFDLKDYDCLWKGARYKIKFDIPNEFPYHAPRCVCEPAIFHPNIDN